MYSIFVSVPIRNPVIFDCRHFGVWMVAVSRVVYTTQCIAYWGWRNAVCWVGAGDHRSWEVGQGNKYRMGRGWMLSDFLLKTFEDDLENFAVGNCVGITEVVVYGSLLINVKSSDGIEVEAFLWNYNIFMMSCMFPVACRFIAKFYEYLEAWFLHRNALFCFFMLVFCSV